MVVNFRMVHDRAQHGHHEPTLNTHPTNSSRLGFDIETNVFCAQILFVTRGCTAVVRTYADTGSGASMCTLDTGGVTKLNTFEQMIQPLKLKRVGGPTHAKKCPHSTKWYQLSRVNRVDVRISMFGV